MALDYGYDPNELEFNYPEMKLIHSSTELNVSILTTT
jgi:hypothetical protein